jgi:hypothetical protein
MIKEVIVVDFKLLHLPYPGKTEADHEYFGEGGW